MACLRYLLQSHRVPITIVIAFLLLDATRAMNTTTSIVARPDPHVTSAAAQATSATELTPQWTTDQSKAASSSTERTTAEGKQPTAPDGASSSRGSGPNHTGSTTSIIPAKGSSSTSAIPTTEEPKLSLWYGAISFGILGAMASFCVFMLVCLGIICAPKSVEPGAPPELDRTLV